MQLDALNFNQACEYLSLQPSEMVKLRDIGLLAAIESENGQRYLRTHLDLTLHLLHIGTRRGWTYDILAWYADLLFASNIGRAILLPLHEKERRTALAANTWIGLPYHTAVLETLQAGEDRCDEMIILSLASLVAVSVGEDRFWPSIDSLMNSDLAPILAHFKDHGLYGIDTSEKFARDISTNFATILLAFVVIASPISKEFDALIYLAKQGINRLEPRNYLPSAAERSFISRESKIPVDKLYASKITEIHSRPERWDFKVGVMQANRRTIAVQMSLPDEAQNILIDNILDMVQPFLGPFGARIVHLLYEIANDPPYYRTPVITVDTNEMLDRLGLKRDSRGLHRSKNRERLRNALNAAHALEVVGEYTTWVQGKSVRQTFYRTVLSIIGAAFDAEENASLSTAELRTKGLPKSMQLRLNFYDSIRRPDGTLGDQFVLFSRLPKPQSLEGANYSATHERLRAYLMFRFRQMRPADRVLVVTQQTALEKGGIRNKNLRQANATLRKALDKLVVNGTLESFTTIQSNPNNESIVFVISEQTAATDD